MHGRLMDTSASEAIGDQILDLVEAGTNQFIIDLSHLEYINSTGLNVLIHILTKARNADGEAVLCNLSKAVKQLFIVTKLSSVFTICDTLEDAELKINNTKKGSTP